MKDTGMEVEFAAITNEAPGTITALLRTSYADLLERDPAWESEQAGWDEYDRQIFLYRDTVGACLFLTRLNGQTVGFGSWDPRPGPEYGIVGHNCILPRFRGKGLGCQQLREILRRFQLLRMKVVKVSTCDHPFFIPAQRMYVAVGFREVRRIPSTWNPNLKMIEYEKDLET